MQRMRWIPPGSFMMGAPNDEPGSTTAERPYHEVTIDQGFWMFETACSEDLWLTVMGSASHRQLGVTLPITKISRNDVLVFIQRINAAVPDLALELPTEAQWEYACRAGTTTPYGFGDQITVEQVCYDSDGPVAIGSLPPNPWGLQEMHGNVWEWCADSWHDNYNDAPTNGSAWFEPDISRYVIRGGAWSYGARDVRSACRGEAPPEARADNLGFRCVSV